MIVLQDECKRLNISVSELSELLKLPRQTMRDWCKSRPELMVTLFNGISSMQLVESFLQEREAQLLTKLGHHLTGERVTLKSH